MFSVALVKYLYSPSELAEKKFKRPETFIRSGFPLLNQQVSASETLNSEHLSSLLIGWTFGACHVSTSQVNLLQW